MDYLSVDDPAASIPIVPEDLTPSHVNPPDQDQLLMRDAETIRDALNREANRILAPQTADAKEEYEEFSLDYDEAIYRAWYTSDKPGSNLLLGHILKEEVARGAFGKVYKAIDPNGSDVAVKVLHEEMRRNRDLFHAFRRGVRSMKILSDNGVQGMVPYRKASEIPAFVVMDWIDGPNLGDAVASTQISDWDLILRVGSEIADIVRRGHLLAERVLHRDIRPSNVMLRGFYSNLEEWDVVVLDFDLSWHRGAFERSVTHGATLLGYLAPEQIEDIPGVSTRHTAVDSFGLGMVLFFMLSRKDPVPDQHRHADWDSMVIEVAKRHPCAQWVSAPNRFARMVKYATMHNQYERWDMTQIQAELQRLREAVLNPASPRSAELIAEEIAVRCEFVTDYEWDADQLMAVKEQPSGVRLEIRGDESLRRVLASISWGSPGVQGRRNLGKWIGPSMNAARAILVSSGWQIEDAGTHYAHIAVSASVSAQVALQNMRRAVDGLNRALAELRFS